MSIVHPVKVIPVISVLVGIANICLWEAGGLNDPLPDIPANAIYANGEPIPYPSGGYLTYGATT